MPSLEDAIRSARRSLEHSSIQVLVAEQVTAGKVEAKYQKWYEDRVLEIRTMMKSLEHLSATVTLPTDEQDELLKLVESIPQLVRDIRKNKKTVKDIWTLRDNLKPHVLQLKELLLDRQITAYEEALSRINSLEKSAEQAKISAISSATKAQQAEASSNQLTASNTETTKQINRLLATSERRKEKIEESKREAEQELTVLKEVEIDADKSRRTIKAIEKQLEDLASTTTDHISRMRKTEEEIRASVATNSKQKDDYLLELGKIREQAVEVLRNGSAGALYGAYEVRKTALTEKVKKTKQAICWTTAGAVGAAAVIWALSAHFQWPITEQWIAKVGILSPFGFLAWFLVAQYNRERILEEEYASKASMSNSYPAFRDDLLLLTKNGTEPLKEQAVLAAIELSKEIFTDPLRVLKIGSEPRTKELKETKAPEKSNAPEDVATEIANKVGGVLQAATNLIEKAAKLTKVGE